MNLRMPPEKVDYELVFQQMPGLCLILDPAFNIVAQTASGSVGRRDSGWLDFGEIS